MRELIEIVAAFRALQREGKGAALATVVAIEGSAYRRPGARMLVAEDGRTWGGVSGGCLERDVQRRGREVITTGCPQRVRYDTADDESLATGAATGCGGAIDVFIQPINANRSGPLPFFAEVVESRRAAGIGTVLKSDSSDIPVGETKRIADWQNWTPVDLFASSIAGASPEKSPVWIDSSYGLIETRQRNGATIDLFVEHLLPPQSIVIVGAGPDARAVAGFAKALGWHVAVVAARPAIGLHERFAHLADALHITGGDHPLDGVSVSIDSAVVLMSHNVVRDQLALAALPRDVAYVGLLGPRHRTDHILDQLGQSRRESLASPVGLDLGAETPEEIALAIVAEIQASIRGASARPLTQLDRPIHASTRPPTASEDRQRVHNSSCAV